MLTRALDKSQTNTSRWRREQVKLAGSGWLAVVLAHELAQSMEKTYYWCCHWLTTDY